MFFQLFSFFQYYIKLTGCVIPVKTGIQGWASLWIPSPSRGGHGKLRMTTQKNITNYANIF
ncbi:MAG TPA: hypothetical protein DEA89_04530 [Candidatus Moranbacteria bacterium]|nr:hypothetical protein [Candidatus Moranbacteria bacterium]HBU11152.1 hypothetical protein [Candidatus Moranbacteria bacterium]